MASIKFVLDEDEIKEKEDLLNFLATLDRKEKLKLKSFLEGAVFYYHLSQ